jgi:hypothetical protein
MVSEAVGFMSRAADGGGMAAELVTRDFLGGCAIAGDGARDAAARHDAAVVRAQQLMLMLMLCFRSSRALSACVTLWFLLPCVRAQLGIRGWTALG